MTSNRKNLQTHGEQSKVYVPIIRRIFELKHTPGATEVDFSLDDIRAAALHLGLVVRNPGDVIYRMRSRTKLPPEILTLGFFVLRPMGRGLYRFERSSSTVIPLPDGPVTDAIDFTPLPVRRLLPEQLGLIDEQGLLTIIDYNKLMSHFTGLTVYRLRCHVRKSVARVGQAELDEVDVGVALRDDERPIVFPIEAKAAPDAINRVQIISGILYALEFFPGHELRPVAVKVDDDGLIHLLEFNVTDSPADLTIVRHARYRLKLSEQQLALIRQTKVKQ
ncbi:hypothetical protein L6R46_31140 [Myxococcota bacterium]|jgi:hypothetical protein|nr:hypothetical protein [Myxococcota bacterium]